MEISCAQKVMKALCDCSDKVLFETANGRLILSQAIETLSRSLEVLNRQQTNIGEEAEKIMEAQADKIFLLEAVLKNKTAEIEKLKTQLYLEKYTDVAKRNIKAEAIKEYIEKASIKLANNARSDYWHWIEDTLHEVEREMMEQKPERESDSSE